jgi:bisphosphoglycerate-dependent phosphoglycerate mutase
MKPPIIKNYNYDLSYPVYRNCYFKKIKNGESKENVLERLLPYYENDILYTFTENKFPLIVTHKHTARVLMKYLLKMKDEEFENYQLPDKKILLINLDENLIYKNHSELS